MMAQSLIICLLSGEPLPTLVFIIDAGLQRTAAYITVSLTCECVCERGRDPREIEREREESQRAREREKRKRQREEREREREEGVYIGTVVNHMFTVG
jgi:hypothetical protein